MVDRSVLSAENAQQSVNTEKDGSGSELRKIGYHEVVEKTANGQVKATAGTLFGFRIVFVGVTADDTVIISNTTDGSGGTKFTIVAHATDETHVFQIPDGMEFDTGIYHAQSLTGGSVYASYVYR